MNMFTYKTKTSFAVPVLEHMATVPCLEALPSHVFVATPSGAETTSSATGPPPRQSNINIDVNNYVKLFQSAASSLTGEQSDLLYFLIVVLI